MIQNVQCVLVAATEPVPPVLNLSHVLRQVQCRQVQPPIPRFRDEHLPTIKLPRIVAWNPQQAVDRIVRMVAIEVGPKDSVAALGILEQPRVE